MKVGRALTDKNPPPLVSSILLPSLSWKVVVVPSPPVMVKPKIIGERHSSSGELVRIVDSKFSPLVSLLPSMRVFRILSLLM